MNDPPSLPSTLGIEAVQWLGQGTDSLTVRVRGRWRRRRPAWSGQPLLVIEASGTRHRFPAMAEPPSLTGAAPGTWQLSFAVPAAVAGRRGARAWLQLGSVVVPLPVAIESAQSVPQPDEQTLDLRRVRAAELAAEAAARRVAEAQARGRELEARVGALERELGQTRALLAGRERELRLAEQRAHAERGLREELEERLGRAERAADEAETAEHELRISELEQELGRLRRALDEAEHAARAARAARHRAELHARERSGKPALAAEFALATSLAPAPSGTRRSTAPQPGDLQRLRGERQLIEARAELTATVAALRRELAVRTQSEMDLRATVDRERSRREQTEQRVARAYDAIQEVRDELERLRGAGLSAASEQPAGAVEAERLAAALARLREATPPSPPGGKIDPRWLARALESLARRDRASAAALLEPLLSVSARDARAMARRLGAGALARRVRRVGGGRRGRRAPFGLLEELMRTPTRFGQLRTGPRQTLSLAAAMIDPEWSRGERFTIAYDAGPFLHVRDGDIPLVSDATLGPVASTIVCEPAHLPAVLAGERPAGTGILGEQRPLELVQSWLERAQSG